MKKTTSAILILFAALFLTVLCSSCSSGAFTQESFKDGNKAPQLNSSDVESITLSFAANGARETVAFSKEQTERFVTLFNASTVRIREGETTPDYYCVIMLKNGTSFRLDDAENLLGVYFLSIAGESTFTLRHDIKVDSKDLMQFIKETAEGYDG